MAENTVVYQGTGRRKNAVARVRLVPGTGKVTINKRDAEQYFGRHQLVENALAPFKVTDTAGQFDVIALCDGGGISGQSGALRLGIARALLNAGDYRADLKKAGFLTRDARVVERKKYGLKKARRAPHITNVATYHITLHAERIGRFGYLSEDGFAKMLLQFLLSQLYHSF